jgi:predicted enzyme related to lactoylglutathione lyase
MTKLDPIIGVNDVQASARWYQKIFGFKNAHGGEHFAVLTTSADDIVLCLHAWGEHGHPSLMDKTKQAGNGLLLYFKTTEFQEIKKRVEEMGVPVTEKVHVNPNSLKREFSFKDPDGYYLTVTEYHAYEG